MFQIANKKRRGTEIDSPFNKWCKMINTNSLRKVSLDNTANTIKDEKNYSNDCTNHVKEKKQGKFTLLINVDSDNLRGVFIDQKKFHLESGRVQIIAFPFNSPQQIFYTFECSISNVSSVTRLWEKLRTNTLTIIFFLWNNSF